MAQGRVPLTGVPEGLGEIAAAWQLELGRELSGGPAPWVSEVTTAEGTRAVLRVGVSTARARTEASALRAWAGRGAPELLRFDELSGAMLLARVEPGSPPVGIGAHEAAELLRALHVEPPEELPSLGEVVRRRLARAAGEQRASGQKIAWALAKLVELEQDAPPAVLLHGAFADDCLVVCERRGLCAIGPRPCVGDAAYDAGYWVHGHRRPGRRARLDAIVASTGLPRARVRDWAAIVGVHG